MGEVATDDEVVKDVRDGSVSEMEIPVLPPPPTTGDETTVTGKRHAENQDLPPPPPQLRRSARKPLKGGRRTRRHIKHRSRSLYPSTNNSTKLN
jgi:hypothetical protein